MNCLVLLAAAHAHMWTQQLAAVVSKAPDTGIETLAVGHWPGNTDVVRVALQPAPADTHQGLKTNAWGTCFTNLPDLVHRLQRER